MKEELDAAQPELDTVHEGGEELLQLIGESDKPEVEKNVEDMDTDWSTLNTKWLNRQRKLDDALRRATAFQEQLMVSGG